MFSTLGHIALSITRTHVPPILACTPYQILRQPWMISIPEINDPAAMHSPGHSRSVEHTPQASPDAKACPGHDGEGYMKLRARSGVEHDEGCDNPVTDPNADPCLPPRQTCIYHGGGNFPSTHYQ